MILKSEREHKGLKDFRSSYFKKCESFNPRISKRLACALWSIGLMLGYILQLICRKDEAVGIIA